MAYETLNCGDSTCPFIKNGVCKFNKFDEIPCEELTEEEFELLKIEHEGIEYYGNTKRRVKKHNDSIK